MASWPEALYVLGWAVRLVMAPVVVRRKSQPAVCLAWLTIIFLVPLVGLVAYLLIGEVRLPARRIRRHARDVNFPARRDRTATSLRHIVEPEIEESQRVIVHVAENLGGLPILGGNRAEVLSETEHVIDRLVADIEAAVHHVHLLFYIFGADEVGARVADALVLAQRRGVACRVLADAVGSRRFLREIGPRLTAAGVRVEPALPVNPARRWLARIDLRNHRKLAVIDGRIAYTGSQNIIRADYGGKGGVGEWRDLMVRLAGPSVIQLQAVFLEDWEFETGEFVDGCQYFPPPEAPGRVPLQVVPSGPNYPNRTLRDVSLEALHAARRHAAIITPYFVPDEALLVALRLAVVRGVRVDLIVPARADQRLVHWCGQFFLGELVAHGVHIHLHQRGLLHVKSMTIDDGFAMLGTANFDIRSFYLNFEMNLICYDADLNARLHCYQYQCIDESRELDLATWRKRSRFEQWASQFGKLVSPLL